MLQVSNVHAAYGKAPALHGVSVEVPKGHVTALLGPNGAGKTTTIRIISGMMSPTSGNVSLDGKSVNGFGPEKRVELGITCMPEGRAIFRQLTVAENLTVGSTRLSDRAHFKQIRDQVLERFPILKDRQKQLAGTLSGGEQQMLALGAALMSEPRLLVLDEPSLGLAPRVVENIYEIIRAIRDDGITILLAEQNARIAFEVASSAYILGNGKVQLAGPVKDLIEDDAVRRYYLGEKC